MSDNTAHPAILMRISELLCLRLCHDLISPVAAVSNGLELLGDDMASEITSLLSFSVAQAAGWLMFSRVAYGLGGENADALSPIEAATKAEVLNRIRGMIPDDGALFLGAAETVVDISDKFKTILGERGVYATDSAASMEAAAAAPAKLPIAK